MSDALRSHLDKVSASLGKSESLRRLLNYLAQRSLVGNLPKELDIALDVFGKDASFTGADDSVVRVQVRALRQKLDEYYLGPGQSDPLRIQIPKGGYRLVITEQPTSVQAAAPTPAVIPAGEGARRTANWAIAIAAASLLALVGVLLFRTGDKAGTYDPLPVRQSFVWSDLMSSKRPLTIVLGDLVLFTQRDPADGHEQFVRDQSVNTDQQLQDYLARRPGSPGLGNGRTTHLPKSVAYGLADILPIVSDGRRQVTVTILEELRLEDIRDHDIIYIGPLVRLGPLANQYFQLSRFDYDDSKLRLSDRESGEAFGLTGTDQKLRDYGLFAKFFGPSKNHVFIFASVARDVGLLQVARSLSSVEGIASVQGKLASAAATLPGSFEVLMAVSGYKRTDLTAEIVDAHALPPRK